MANRRFPFPETAPGISQIGKADIGNSLNNAFEYLGSRQQLPARKIFEFNFTIGPFFNFLAPGLGEFRGDVDWRQVIVVS